MENGVVFLFCFGDLICWKGFFLLYFILIFILFLLFYSNIFFIIDSNNLMRSIMAT